MDLAGWDKPESPYHEGEQELQGRLGRKERQEDMARHIHRPFMPDQHRAFFAQLPMFIAGSVDAQGWPWASMLFGDPGFVQTPNDKAITLEGGTIQGDPFFENLGVGAPVGFLGIELETRRRNRVNGVIKDASGRLDIDVVQSYGNCPQYIHTRDLETVRDPQGTFGPEKTSFESLPSDVSALITGADTFFVASANLDADLRINGGVDASHRGGKPGFVKIEDNTLTIPDFIGNFAFNTLGNFLINPKAGLLFVDFESGNLVQMVGTIEILWDIDDELSDFRGAERAWRFHLDHGHVLKAAAPYRWKSREISPNSALTGDWSEADQLKKVRQEAQTWREFQLAKVEVESSVISSFFFAPKDGGALLPFKPGQFLTIEATPKGAKQPLVRTYTVSSAPSDPHYRISVKREGVVSSYIHDTLKRGDVVRIKAPKGAFWLDTTETRPAVLLAAGVGITPMMSMARQAVTDGFARRHMRPITVIHAVQTVEQRAFAAAFSALQTKSDQALRYVSVVEHPTSEQEAGRDFHVSGRITPTLIQRLLPLDDYDFFLCGPPPFMQAMYDMLVDLGVQDTRIQAEAFGPASLRRKATNSTSAAFEAVEDAVVTFAASAVEQAWSSDQGSLLEFAEAHGLTPNYGCRSGSCGSCATRLISGRVGYTQKPEFEVEKGEVLLCCSVPAKSDRPLILDL